MWVKNPCQSALIPAQASHLHTHAAWASAHIGNILKGTQILKNNIQGCPLVSKCVFVHRHMHIHMRAHTDMCTQYKKRSSDDTYRRRLSPNLKHMNHVGMGGRSYGLGALASTLQYLTHAHQISVPPWSLLRNLPKLWLEYRQEADLCLLGPLYEDFFLCFSATAR